MEQVQVFMNDQLQDTVKVKLDWLSQVDALKVLLILERLDHITHQHQKQQKKLNKV